MRPKTPEQQSDDLFKLRLDQLLNMNHPLIKLSELIDWDRIDTTLAAHFVSERGRPALPPRLVAGLFYLQHCFDYSDELVVNTWVENPYWQYFTGETYLQTKSPIDPLTH